MPISFIILQDYSFTTTINCMTDFSDNNNVLSNMNIWFSRCDDSRRGRGGEGAGTHLFYSIWQLEDVWKYVRSNIC